MGEGRPVGAGQCGGVQSCSCLQEEGTGPPSGQVPAVLDSRDGPGLAPTLFGRGPAYNLYRQSVSRVPPTPPRGQ